MKPTSRYPIVSWDEVRRVDPIAYDRFHSKADEWIKDNRLRPIFQALLPIKRKLPQVAAVMALFTVRAKLNWKWIGVRLSDEGAGVLFAAGMQNLIPHSLEWNTLKRWWH